MVTCGCTTEQIVSLLDGQVIGTGARGMGRTPHGGCFSLMTYQRLPRRQA